MHTLLENFETEFEFQFYYIEWASWKAYQTEEKLYYAIICPCVYLTAFCVAHCYHALLLFLITICSCSVRYKMEQRINLKFLVKLGKRPNRLLEASAWSLWGSHDVTCVFVWVAQALHQWPRRCGRWPQVWTDGLSQQKLQTTSAKWMSKATTDWPCAWWQRSSTLTANWFAPFCWRSSTCIKCAPRLCPSFCQTTRSSIVFGFAKTCSSELEQIQISLAASSLETNLGCSSTTQKPRGRVSSGQPQIHHDPRKRACQSRKSRPCWSLSSTKRVWCITSLCLRSNSKPALLSASPQPPQRPGSPLQTSSLERQVLDAPPWQCACTHCAQRAAAVGQQAGRSARPPSLLAWTSLCATSGSS